METLNYIQALMGAYALDLSSIDTENEAEYNERAQAVRECTISLFNAMRDSAPELLQYNFADSMSDEEIRRTINRIALDANKRYTAPILPDNIAAIDYINGEPFVTPTYVKWQSDGYRRQNFVINYNGELQSVAKRQLTALMQNMLLCFAPGKIRFNIFDQMMSGMADFVTVGYDEMVYNGNVIMDEAAARDCIKRLRERMQMVMGKYGDIARYNEKHQEIVMPYEVVVLNDYPARYENLTAELQPLFENGAKGGIYFIVMHNADAPKLKEDAVDILTSETITNISLQTLGGNRNNLMVNHTPIAEHSALADAFRVDFNKRINEKGTRQVLKADYASISHSEYTDVTSEISITVGLDTEDKHPVTLRFNSGDYIHGFILGQSGSGKSVLLNNIISAAILKYAPEDLMLYLMDFKGVEFNRYRGVKHVKALLVDNSDPQMTLEVLRELQEENKRRVKLWRDNAVNNIDGYNKKNPTSRLPQILFVADECQVMFAKPTSNSYGMAIQREISEILNVIATQGRSQGIHMLLATQQLDETDISGQILKNLTECFLLMSAASDSNKLVPDSEKLTSKQPTGQACYYHKRELQSKVQTFYATDEELADAIEKAREKSTTKQSNGEAYFSGSSIYHLQTEDLQSAKTQSYGAPVATIGRSIGLNQQSTAITLTKDFSENIIVWGANRQEQATATAINALVSLMAYYEQSNTPCNFIVLDCTNNPMSQCKPLLAELEKRAYCKIIHQSEGGKYLKMIADDIYRDTAPNLILTILGQDRFSEMKRNSLLMEEKKVTEIKPAVSGLEMLSFDPLPDLGANNITDGSKVKKYQEALKYILDEGPKHHVHVLMQVDKPGNILFDEFGKEAIGLFKHRVILKSENKHLAPLRFGEDIDVQSLSDDNEHLRAYYYPDGEQPMLFTPFLLPDAQYLFNAILIN